MDTIKKVIGALVISFAMATLVACGGGGGGGSPLASGSPTNGTPASPGNPTGTPTNGGTPTPTPEKNSISGCIIGATHSITIITTPGGASATTNATSGCYTIANLPNGDYTVTPSDGSVVFVPKSTKSLFVGNGNGCEENKLHKPCASASKRYDCVSVSKSHL